MSNKIIERESSQHNSTSNNLNDNEEGPEDSSNFIVKRTEISDIFYFNDSLIRGIESPQGKILLDFNSFFNSEDIEMAFENITFSITVLDQNENNAIAGVFLFNNTPFAPIKIEDPDNQIPLNPGLWEQWFENNFEDKKINGKNCLWLVYFVLDEKYAHDEKAMEKIFLKVHLSLYTTLNSYDSVMFLLTKNQFNEIETYQKPNYENNEENQDFEGTAIQAIKTMVNYIYEPVKEIQNEKNIPNNFCTFMNKRTVVFPIIEIREGAEYDHDDLENIFKEQTPAEISNNFEDFFIAKMIARQDKDNKVLVGQVNDKAIGMMAISTDINISFLQKNFELEEYDNLLCQD
jgi:hypothetical protein